MTDPLAAFNAANARARHAYHAEQDAKPNNPRACLECSAPTKTRSGVCAECGKEDR